jgi:GTPase SAR1 family protein
MIRAPEQSLAEIAAAIDDAIDRPSSGQQRLLERLRDQAARLSDTVFQLAVLGQFKRGKSTLLNAFVGYPLLSAGVLPLTAVPTFLSASPTMKIRLNYVSYITGSFEEREAKTLEELAAAIAAATTEEQNPYNVKGLERVDVGVPFNQWLGDITLIDTPGIGSTYSHNTDTAHAVLPECDAALFVLSVDPPITDVEAQYLAAVCRTVSRIIVVLNKVDLVDPNEQKKALGFLSSVLSRRTEPQLDQRIFPVSARRALAARQDGDRGALIASGLPALEQYLRSSLVDQKRGHLEVSIAKKISDILAALEADAALTARALTVPLTELDEKITLFEATAADFIRERDNLGDLLSGEWRRALDKVSVLCEAAEKRARSQLDRAVADVAVFSDPRAHQAVIQSVMSVVFDKEFATIGTAVDQDLAASVTLHQQRYHALAAHVQEAAAALMDVPVPQVAPDDWFQIKREPYWIGQARVENLSSITVDGLARILPARLRRQRELKRLRAAVGNAVTRNISDLHWTMRQNIDDSFRRLLASASEAVDRSIASTREVLRMAQEHRRSTDTSLQHEIERAQAITRRLVQLREQLDRHRKKVC